MNQKERSILSDILYNGIYSSKEWEHLQFHNKEIKEAEDKWNRALEMAKPYLLEHMQEALEETMCRIAVAYSEAAILYGMMVEDILKRGCRELTGES